MNKTQLAIAKMMGGKIPTDKTDARQFVPYTTDTEYETMETEAKKLTSNEKMQDKIVEKILPDYKKFVNNWVASHKEFFAELEQEFGSL